MSTDPNPGITIVDGGTLPPPAHATAAFTATHLTTRPAGEPEPEPDDEAAEESSP